MHLRLSGRARSISRETVSHRELVRPREMGFLKKIQLNTRSAISTARDGWLDPIAMLSTRFDFEIVRGLIRINYIGSMVTCLLVFTIARGLSPSRETGVCGSLEYLLEYATRIVCLHHAEARCARKGQCIGFANSRMN